MSNLSHPNSTANRIFIRYGRGELPLDVPLDVTSDVLRLNALPVLADADEAIEKSLQQPIGCVSLREMARERESACVVICDVTRPVPNERILTPLLRELEAAGMAREKIVILIATGLHRPNLGDELKEVVGASIAANYRVVNHDAQDSTTHTSLGRIEFGDNQNAQVALSTLYMQSDLKIAVGLIEPHYMAGYSGGRKVICPGVASAETLLQFHSAAMIAHPASRSGNLKNNPVHAMSRAVAKASGLDFICNVTLSEAREITGVFSGQMDAAHEAGIALVDKQSKVSCRAADIVVCSNAGYPLDATVYQMSKGMEAAACAAKTGATLILAASLTEGLGGKVFTSLCESAHSPQDFLQRLKTTPVQIDQWGLQKHMQLVSRFEVMVISDGLSPEALRKIWVKPMPDLNAALDAALEKHGRNALVNVIPEGPYVLPVQI